MSSVFLLDLTTPIHADVTNCTEGALRSELANGGLVRFACDGTIVLSNTIVVTTSTTLDGAGHNVIISGGGRVGVFCVRSVAFTALNLVIANGLSTNGGAICNEGGMVGVTNCCFTGNTAAGVPGSAAARGGAIYSDGTLSISACSLLQNTAFGTDGAAAGESGGSASGGAICNLGLLTMNGSLLASNSATGGAGAQGYSGTYTYGGIPPDPGGPGGTGGDALGGAVFNAGTACLVNCTLAFNQGHGGAGGEGGECGVDFVGYPPYQIPGAGGNGGNGGNAVAGIAGNGGLVAATNCTLAFNAGTAGARGNAGVGDPPGSYGLDGTAVGGIQAIPGALLNTLLATNPPANAANTLTDAGHNLSSDASAGFTDPTSLTNQDPRLGPLANYGGPTLTLALLRGSPAINAGDSSGAPLTDQRGVPRPIGSAADIGAFEYGVPWLGIAPSEGAGFDITASGADGPSCSLLMSSNLLQWTPVATNSIDQDGTAIFHQITTGTGQFFKAVTP